MKWNFAPDISTRVRRLVHDLSLSYINCEGLICFRSFGSSSRAAARIWSLPTIWQLALKVKPCYCIEVLSEKFDRLPPDDQERVLIHELLHIPQTFSGALLSHRHHPSGRKTHRHYHARVETLFRSLTSKSYQ